MRVSAAYIGVVLIWGTTPLAIKWSGEGPGFVFGVTGRVAIGTLCVLLALAALRQRLPVQRTAFLTYLIGGVNIYGAMLAVYWASQFIPSGWISVVFGLSPLLTALMAAVWLGERSLSPGKLLAYGLGIGGLAVMFGSALEFGREAVFGIGGVLVSAFLQSASSVWIKRLDSRAPALSVVAGSLLIALPAYLATWALLDGRWPSMMPLASLASIVYLGTIATTLGFAWYFYVLKHLSATRVALIALVSPVLALIIGHLANGEPFSPRVLLGAGLILSALLLHEFSGRRWARGLG